MATHGTIMLQEMGDNGEFDTQLLQTTHDGHDNLTLYMLLMLPYMVAEKHYFKDILSDPKDPHPTREEFNDRLFCLNTPEFHMDEMGHFISHWYFNRWYVINDTHAHWLADYDLDPKHHIYVTLHYDPRFEDDEEKWQARGTYFIKFDKGLSKEKALNLKSGWAKNAKRLGKVIENLNANATYPIEVLEDGIVVPATSIFADRVYQLVEKKLRK